MSAVVPIAAAQGVSLLDTVSTPIALVDATGRVTFANRSLRDIVPVYPRTRVDELFGLGADPEVLAALNKALAANEPFVGDLPSRLEGRLWRVHASAAEGPDGWRTLSFEDITERRRLRDLLRASDARLELAMAASELAMWDWDVARDEVYYNDQWSIVLGIAPEALLQRTDLAARLMLPEDQPEVLEQFERHYHGETPSFESEYRLQAGDGSMRWYAARAKVVRRDAEGRALRVIGVLYDVTRRRNAQQEAHEAQLRWERAVRGTSDGLYDWDLSTGHVWYAARFREILGYAASEFPDRFTAFQNALHADDRSTVMERIRAHLEGGVELDVRCRLRRKDGAYLWCRLRGQCERDAAGRPRRLAGSISDISAQIAAEDALRRSQSFYDTVINSLPLLIAYADSNERIVFANRFFQEFFGAAPDEHGLPAAEVLGAETYAAIRPSALRALAGQTVDLQGPVRNREGKCLNLDATLVPHREGNRVSGCFVVARDVTERVLLEAELRQSQKMEAIGRLTGGIAHDFNNLLSVILGNLQLLVRSLQETPRLLKQAETALRAAMRGSELTRRLLAFARQQVLEPSILDVNELIVGMYELFRRALAPDVEVRHELAPYLWPIKVDPGQLENAVLNLVINARDAMPNGGIVRIVTRNVEINSGNTGEQNPPDGAYTVVEVSDSGCGMSPEVLKRAFEPFFTTKDVGKGSGLGLSMVYGFVKQSGGYITMSSTEGVGTTVQLYFPRAHGTPAANHPSRAPSELARGTETVLVIEADHAVRETAIELLSSLGYRPLAAASEAQARELFARHPEIALVFSDVMLPGGVLGTQLVAQLRERRPEVKVLLTSGCMRDAESRARVEVPDEVLTKPYSLEELARRVRCALGERHEEQQLAST
jgi:PAS domain S-box-containing protein